jgi:CRP/FNR family transcriptional regulator, cyclic AMP receptor protein
MPVGDNLGGAQVTQGSWTEADPIVSTGWLALLEPPTRAKVLDACTMRKSDRGKVLYRVGDAPDGLYGLISGSIRLDTVQSDHGPTMLNIFHAGSWLGEVEMFSRIPRITTMIVLRPVEYLYLPATALEFVGKASPGSGSRPTSCGCRPGRSSA